MHTQEWERTTGFIRTASGFPQLHAQLARNALQFSSRAQATRSPASPGGKRAVPANMFRNATGRNATSSTVSTDNFSLANDAIVPVYDARNVASLDLEEVLPRLSQVLPIYTGGEIPYGSFVTVGYTMTIYRSNSGMWTLGCNVLWIIVLGIPPTA
ncbi:hypothetical protein DFP72DRAFT_833748 [Ephemerocybe angulata]|uniref:Uncharacterized protein n=1 Tax=Ephemerocybe angulata TaxID=980116 RepID=A0A8H6H7J3_9AGAR|nr:hypothetical protein DFP72DRAFT_833748 [Tulosesus angulatus]